jgi:hypothetical protein
VISTGTPVPSTGFALAVGAAVAFLVTAGRLLATDRMIALTARFLR